MAVGYPMTGPQTRRRAELVESLLERGLIDASALVRAELVSVRTGQPVEQVLNQLGSLSDDDLVSAYAASAGCAVWDPRANPATLEADAVKVSADFLRRSRLLPLSLNRGALLCAACDPLDDEALAGLVFATGKPVNVLAARQDQLLSQ